MNFIDLMLRLYIIMVRGIGGKVSRKRLTGMSKSGAEATLQGISNEVADGDLTVLVSTYNESLISVSEHLPCLQGSHPIFSLDEPQLPADLTISVEEVEAALNKVKTNKATGPDGIPAWILKEFSVILPKPLAAIFNSSLREGVLPDLWKSANILPLPKVHP